MWDRDLPGHQNLKSNKKTGREKSTLGLEHSFQKEGRVLASGPSQTLAEKCRGQTLSSHMLEMRQGVDQTHAGHK